MPPTPAWDALLLLSVPLPTLLLSCMVHGWTPRYVLAGLEMPNTDRKLMDTADGCDGT